MVKETTSTKSESDDEEYIVNDLLETCRKDGQTKMIHYGSDYLKPQELLEVLISSKYKRGKAAKVATALWKAFDQSLIDIFTASIHQLTQVEGIGFAEACQIKAVFELIKRIESCCKEMHPVITSAKDVVHLLAPHMRYLKQEEFRVVLLDSEKRLICHQRISLGSLDAAIVEPREVFRPAIAENAQSLILIHNHPSGDPTPSEQDILLTRQLYMCGKILSIEISDHIIIGCPRHVSFKDEQLL